MTIFSVKEYNEISLFCSTTREMIVIESTQDACSASFRLVRSSLSFDLAFRFENPQWRFSLRVMSYPPHTFGHANR